MSPISDNYCSKNMYICIDRQAIHLVALVHIIK